MKPFYQITEVARLYGLHPDTLRYYEEQGLLHPVRGENRYRMYGIDDICNINVIRALRELGIPVERIRRYTGDRRCETTLRLLDEQEEAIGQRLARLRSARAQVRARRSRLLAAQALPVGEARVLELSARRGLLLRQRKLLSFEIDYALKKLESRHAELLQGLGSLCMGAWLDRESFLQGDLTRYSKVFFLGEELGECPAILPAGRYLSLVYAGDYDAFPGRCRALLGYAREHGLEAAGPPLELYHIDAHDTDRPDEYRTEIQIPLAGAGEDRERPACEKREAGL